MTKKDKKLPLELFILSFISTVSKQNYGSINATQKINSNTTKWKDNNDSMITMEFLTTHYSG